MTRFDDIQARHAKATPGPWEAVEQTEWEDAYVRVADGQAGETIIGEHFRQFDGADAEFIAACPDDVRWLLDRVKELEAERETGSTPHKCLNDQCETVAYGTGYNACPSCGDTSGRDAEPT